jgi:hypothetical protein
MVIKLQILVQTHTPNHPIRILYIMYIGYNILSGRFSSTKLVLVNIITVRPDDNIKKARN